MKVGDTFVLAMRLYGEPIHKPPMPCIILKTNMSNESVAYPMRECPVCKVMVGFTMIDLDPNRNSRLRNYIQVLAGNKKLILIFSDCSQFLLRCPEG